jgi:hypothetical protein
LQKIITSSCFALSVLERISINLQAMVAAAPLKYAGVFFLLAGAILFVVGYATDYMDQNNSNDEHVGLWNFCSTTSIVSACFSIDNSCSIDQSIPVVTNCNEFLAARAFGLLAIIVSFCAFAAAAMGIFKSSSIVDKAAVGLAGAAASFGIIGFALLSHIGLTDPYLDGFSVDYSYALITAGWIAELVGAVLAGVAAGVSSGATPAQ